MYSEEYFEKVARVDALNRETIRLITVTKALDYLYGDIRPGTYYQLSNGKRVMDQMKKRVDELVAEIEDINKWIEANVKSGDEGM